MNKRYNISLEEDLHKMAVKRGQKITGKKNALSVYISMLLTKDLNQK